MFSLFSSSGTGRARKTKKRNTKGLDISGPSEFQHVLHYTHDDFPGMRPTPPTPRLDYELPIGRSFNEGYHRSQSEGPPSMAQTLPRNLRLNRSSHSPTITSPLDNVVPPVTDDQLRDSARSYYNRKTRPQLPPQWNARPSPGHTRPRGSSQGNIIVNSNYMTCPATGGSSDYGTMTDSMGSRRSTGSRTNILNSVYVERETLEKYKAKENLKGILKTTETMSTERRLYQPVPFNERNLPNNSVGKRIRSSTELRAWARSASPSPLTRPSVLPMTPTKSELSLSSAVTTPLDIFQEDTKTPLSFSSAQSVSVLIKDSRPVSAKVRDIYDKPKDEEEDLEEGTIIIHL